MKRKPKVGMPNYKHSRKEDPTLVIGLHEVALIMKRHKTDAFTFELIQHAARRLEQLSCGLQEILEDFPPGDERRHIRNLLDPK